MSSEISTGEKTRVPEGDSSDVCAKEESSLDGIGCWVSGKVWKVMEVSSNTGQDSSSSHQTVNDKITSMPHKVSLTQNHNKTIKKMIKICECNYYVHTYGKQPPVEEGQ